MKKLLYMVVAVLALSSCNNWFDVAPKEEYIDEDALFSSESAFRNALNGIYTELRSSELFGSNLGLGGIEFMGQTLVPDSELKPIAEFDYDSRIMKEKIEQVWASMYHAIYSCNNLLRLFDKNQDVIFIKGAREVMLAELKVLRVAMHYDLVRLFHPAYTSEPSFKGIYWKESTGDELQQLSTQELCTKMLAQLTEAIAILKKYDPIYTG